MFPILNLIIVFNVRKKSQRLARVILIYLKYTDGVNVFFKYETVIDFISLWYTQRIKCILKSTESTKTYHYVNREIILG